MHPLIAALVIAAAPDSVPRESRAPEDAGMSSARLAAIDHVLERAVAARGFPGAAVAVGREGAVVWSRGYGRVSWTGADLVRPEATVYDVASLTKVVATTAAAMVLHDRGRLRLDDRVARWLPEFRGGERGRISVRDLLTHRSGLPAGRDLEGVRSVAEARRRVLSTALVRAPGERHEYSDVGAIVLGILIERVTGEPLDRFVTREIYRPLGMRSTGFRPSAYLRARSAPTGATSFGEPAPRGVVHDGTARALGGVAGHAGLFSTAEDLARFARMMLGGGMLDGRRVVSEETVRLFTRRAAGPRALGWEMCGGGGSCGHVLGAGAFGHTGFTGTSMWIDPERDTFVIVLTNWVHTAPGGRVPPLAVLHDVRGDVADIAALSVEDAFAPQPFPERWRADRAIGWPRQ